MEVMAWLGVILFVCKGTSASISLGAVLGISPRSNSEDLKMTSAATTQRVTDVSAGLDALPTVRALISPEDENDLQEESVLKNDYNKPEGKILDLNTNNETFGTNHTNLTSDRGVYNQTIWLPKPTQTKNETEETDGHEEEYDEDKVPSVSDQDEHETPLLEKGVTGIFQDWAKRNLSKQDDEITTFKYDDNTAPTIKTSVTQINEEEQYGEEISTLGYQYESEKSDQNADATTTVANCEDCETLLFEDNLDDVLKSFTQEIIEPRGKETVVNRFYTNEEDTLLFDDGPSAAIPSPQRSGAIDLLDADGPMFDEHTPHSSTAQPADTDEDHKHEKLRASAAANCADCKEPLFQHSIQDVIDEWADEAKETVQRNNQTQTAVNLIEFNSRFDIVNETEEDVTDTLEARMLNDTMANCNDCQFPLFENTPATLSYEETTTPSNNFSEALLMNGNASFHGNQTFIFEGKEEEATEIIEEYVDGEEEELEGSYIE